MVILTKVNIQVNKRPGFHEVLLSKNAKFFIAPIEGASILVLPLPTS